MKNIILGTILSSLMLVMLSSAKEKGNKIKNTICEKVITKLSVSDTIFDSKNRYYSFIKVNYPEVLNDRVLFFLEKDIDLDGHNEAVVAFSRSLRIGWSTTNILVLKNENGNIKQIKGDFGLENYSVEEVKFISLHGKKQSYIYLNYSDGFNKNGFAIYEIFENRLKQLFVTSALRMVVNSYQDRITDSNQDEKFDGHFESIAYAGFNIEKEFVFEDNLFKLKNTTFVFKDYPSSIEEVINQYLCVRSFDNNDSIVKQRLEQLCLDKTADKISWDKKDWGFAYYRNIISNLPLLVVENNGDGISAKAFFRNSQLKFKLQKNRDKWQITKIDVVK